MRHCDSATYIYAKEVTTTCRNFESKLNKNKEEMIVVFVTHEPQRAQPALVDVRFHTPHVNFIAITAAATKATASKHQ